MTAIAKFTAIHFFNLFDITPLMTVVLYYCILVANLVAELFLTRKLSSFTNDIIYCMKTMCLFYRLLMVESRLNIGLYTR